jgi:hypothetical protein
MHFMDGDKYIVMEREKIEDAKGVIKSRKSKNDVTLSKRR